MLIDFHTHIFPDNIAAAAVRGLSETGGIPPHSDGTRAGLLAAMRGAGVTHAVNLPVLTSPAQFDSVLRFAAAQNALLIALEEPPANVVIFLLCEDAASLLPTVRSRVQCIRMALFTPERLDAFLQDNRDAKRLRESNPTQYREILTVAAGSPGMALDLLRQKNINALTEERKIVTDILSCVNSRARYANLHEATARLSTKRQELAEELTSLILAIRDLIVVKEDEDAPLCFWGDCDSVAEIAATFSLRCLFTVYDALRDARLQLSQNANVHVVITSLNSALFHAPTK